MTKTVLIAAGGTGGHVFPGLALARELQSRQYQVHWLGTKAGIESRLVPLAGFDLHFIPVQGVRGRGFWALFMAPLLIVQSVLQVIRVLQRVRPGLVVGLGGFVAGPGGLAAKIMRTPLVIHEQNARAGTTNKLLTRIANRTLIAFPGVLPKGFYIGNPVREEFFSATAKVADKQALRLLVVGGSRGARAVNQLIVDTLKMLGSASERLVVMHQCGEKLFGETLAMYESAGVLLSEKPISELNHGDVSLVPFISDMASSFHWADLVISRAGALTVAELAAAGLPSLLIPFPYAIDDHQTANAQFLVDAGAAFLWQQSDINPSLLSEKIRLFMRDKSALNTMREAAKRCAKPDAVKLFADECETIYNKAVV